MEDKRGGPRGRGFSRGGGTYVQKGTQGDQYQPKEGRGGAGRGGDRPATAYQRKDTGEQNVKEVREVRQVREVYDESEKKPYRGGRPQTAYERGGRGQDSHGAVMHGEHRGGMRGTGRKELDENSWQFKYRNGKRPELEKFNVNIDTVLPELPTTILKRPLKPDFDHQMKKLDDQIEQLKAEIESNKYKKRQALDGGRVDGESGSYKELILNNIEEVKKARNERRTHLERLGAIKEKMQELEKVKDDLSKNLPRGFNTEREVEQAIKEKKRKYETSSMSNIEEKTLLKEIDSLKKALPDLKKLSEIDPVINDLKKEKRKIQADLDIVKKLIDEKDRKINDVKQQSDEIRSKKSEVRDIADSIQMKIDKQQEDLSSIYKKKDEQRENYFKGLYEFEVQQEQVRHIRMLRAQQRRLKLAHEDRQKRIDAKRAEVENRQNPNAKKIETCELLVEYCLKLKAQAGLVPLTSEQVAVETQKNMISEYNKQDIEQKLKDGKLMAFEKKEDITVVGAKQKGPKGKKPRKEENEKKPFNIDFAVIGKFAQINLSPPIDAENIDSKVDELKKKLKNLIEEGESILQKEKQDLERIIEEEVERDIEREQKALDAEYGDYGEEEEEKKVVEQVKPAKKVKQEFEASEDEEEEPSASDFAYSKPTRGGASVNTKPKGRGKPQKIALDDDNFPEL